MRSNTSLLAVLALSVGFAVSPLSSAQAGQLFPPTLSDPENNNACSNNQVLGWTTNGTVKCIDPTPGVNLSCPAGTVMAGISGGAPVCTTNGLGLASFTTPGTISWAVPVNVTKIQIEVWGGGGGANGGHTSTGEGGTGGGGGYALGTFNVTPGSTYTITVGGGGAAGTYGTTISAGNGGQSSFGNLIAATGGNGGDGYGGTGGQGTGGQLNINGGYGFDLGSISVISGSSNNCFGARGGNSPRGGSGGGMYSGWTNGRDGSIPNLGLNGGQPGGGGAGNCWGSGSGAPGAVLIHY